MRPRLFHAAPEKGSPAGWTPAESSHPVGRLRRPRAQLEPVELLLDAAIGVVADGAGAAEIVRWRGATCSAPAAAAHCPAGRAGPGRARRGPAPRRIRSLMRCGGRRVVALELRDRRLQRRLPRQADLGLHRPVAGQAQEHEQRAQREPLDRQRPEHHDERGQQDEVAMREVGRAAPARRRA